MKKILAFVSSPRRNGYSTQLLNQVVEGAKSAGAEVILYDLNDDNIRGCQSCYYCRTHEGCATRDALQPMYEQIKDADAVVASFPLYFMNINAQAKKLIDRLYPMIGNDFSPRYPGKKAVTIYSQGNVNPDLMKSAIDTNDRIIGMFCLDLIKSFVISNTVAPAFGIPEEMMQEAYEVGKSLME